MARLPEDAFERAWGNCAKQARREVRRRYELERCSVETFELGTDFREVWRVKVCHPKTEWLEVLVPITFPFRLPFVRLPEGIAVSDTAHVSQQGLCLFDEATSLPDPTQPGAVALTCISRAIEVLSSSGNGEPDDGFVNEFFHFWQLGDPETFLALLHELETARPLKVLLLQGQSIPFNLFVADDLEEAKVWVTKANLGPFQIGREAMFIPNIAMTMPPFPKDNRTTYEHIKQIGGSQFKCWNKEARSRERPTMFVSTLPTSNGLALYGWIHKKPKIIKLPKGFRKGKTPIELEFLGHSSSQPIIRLRGERIDRERLVARTIGAVDAAPARTALLIGTGAIGSLLAARFTEARVLRGAILIDNQSLAIVNVLRHWGDFCDVGQMKSDIVKRLMEQSDPDLQVKSHPSEALQTLGSVEIDYDKVDLVVLALGSQFVEEEITKFLLHRLRPGVAINSVWLRANAEKGFVTRSISGQRGCFSCLLRGPDQETLFEEFGPNTVFHEPGCSPGFSQYGGSRLSRYVTLASDAILRPATQPSVVSWTPWESLCQDPEAMPVDAVEVKRLNPFKECSNCAVLEQRG